MPDQARTPSSALPEGNSPSGVGQQHTTFLPYDQLLSGSVDGDRFSVMPTANPAKQGIRTSPTQEKNADIIMGLLSSANASRVVSHSTDGGTSVTFKRTPRTRTTPSYFDLKPTSQSPMGSPLSPIHSASRAMTSDIEKTNTFFTTRSPSRGATSPGPQRPMLTQDVAYAHAFAAPRTTFNLRRPPTRSTPSASSDSASGMSQDEAMSDSPSSPPADFPSTPVTTPPSNYSSYSHDRNPEPPRSFATFHTKPPRQRTKVQSLPSALRDGRTSSRPPTPSTAPLSVPPTSNLPSLSELNAFGDRIMQHASIPPPSVVRRIDRMISGTESTSSVTLVDFIPDDASTNMGSSVGGSSSGCNIGKGRTTFRPRTDSHSTMTAFMQSMKDDPSFSPSVKRHPLSPRSHKAPLLSPPPSRDQISPVPHSLETKKGRSSRRKGSSLGAPSRRKDPHHVPTFNTWVDTEENDSAGALMRAQLESQLSKMLQRTRIDPPTVAIGETRWAVGEERSPINGEQDIIILNTSKPGKAAAVIMDRGGGAVVGVIGPSERSTASQGPTRGVPRDTLDRKQAYNPAKTYARGLRLAMTGTISEPLGREP